MGMVYSEGKKISSDNEHNLVSAKNFCIPVYFSEGCLSMVRLVFSQPVKLLLH